MEIELALSVILPCYNVEKYIAKCLDSLYAQDIPETEYEVICVNDCSPDGTRDIIVSYQQKHPNLILIDHDINKKQGGARNTGLRAAQGEYIWFVDPDDYVKENCFKKIIELATLKEVDILLFNYARTDIDGKVIQKLDFDFLPNAIFEGRSVFKYDNCWEMYTPSWDRLVRRKFYLENNIYFYENFYYEDNIFGVQVFFSSSKVAYSPTHCYYYRTNPLSDMHSEMNGAKLASHVKMAQQYKYYSAKLKDDEYISKLFEDEVVYLFKSIKKRFKYLTIKEKKIFYKKLQTIENIADLSNMDRYVTLIIFYPIISSILFSVISPLIIFLRDLKRKSIPLKK